MSVLLGGVLAFLVSGTSIGFIRDTLRYNCTWGIGGEWGPNGTWACGDGIGYLGAAVALGGMSALLLLIGLLTAIAMPSRGRSITYLTLALISLGWVGWWTFFGATFYSGPRPEGQSGASQWTLTVLPGWSFCALGIAIGAFGALGRLKARRRSEMISACGIGLILIGTVIQPGIGIATLVSAGLLAAAGTQPRDR